MFCYRLREQLPRERANSRRSFFQCKGFNCLQNTITNYMNKSTKGMEKGLDYHLWHACAGGMVQMPPVNSKVFYFPQGHAEHAHGNVEFRNFPRIPSQILCRVSAIKYLADPETDEVFSRLSLVPLRTAEIDLEDDGVLERNGSEVSEKPVSFAKTLTQSDANNGGGFSVPRYCAETIFPRLDYRAEPPVQTILAKDVHGETWKFRHIYRGTPRRHLLTTGWSNFVNQKKLVAGDSIVFLRAEHGDLCVGIRRAKRGIGDGLEYPSGWSPASASCSPLCGGFSVFLREDENRLMQANGNGCSQGRGRVRPESVIEAATLAAAGQPFEVVYYPRASSPEFCVKVASLRAAMQIQWCSGMRFKMAFETEDSSRISWFMGTVSSVQVADPIHWPNSPWRLLQVTWDEPDLLQNVKRVSPWLVELASNMPAANLSPFSPPLRKKLRLPQNSDFSLLGQLPVPSFSSNLLRSNDLLCYLSDHIPGGIQGARHAQFGLPSSDLHFNKQQSGQFPINFHRLCHTAPPSTFPSDGFVGNPKNDENISCLLTMGNSTPSTRENNNAKKPRLVLFGQPILTEQQISQSCSNETGRNSSSDGNTEKTTNISVSLGSACHALESSADEGGTWYKNLQKTKLGLETGHCKVFMESEDVGQTLDLSVLGSYEELYRKLADMFGLGRAEMPSSVLYRDEADAIKHTGDEPFSEFLKTAKRLTILADSISENMGR
ncbi:auxin response factor 16-like [Malania oleifera]|uniref:auxin response factor 16-like n=1 Tax=Malania oleifera TaxID=397392 RepID=UPI0025AEB91C|nr:auxin response factor 16-like [Malania oleifera]